MKKYLSWLLLIGLALGLVAGPAAADLTSYTRTKLYGYQTGSADLSTPSDTLNASRQQDYADGSGNEQADFIFHDSRNLAASATENLDLAGSLTDKLGNTLTFTAVKVLYIRNTSTTQTLSVGGAAANQFINWVANSSDIVNVPPLGELLVTAPYAGFAVTAGTGDILKVANSAGAAVDYYIVIIGK